MRTRAAVTLDWLRKGRMVEDLTILRYLIADSSAWKLVPAKRDENLFESKFDLQPLPKEPSTEAAINRAIGQDEVTENITTKMKPLIPIGDTIRDQVSSLFHSLNLNKTDTSALSYVFSRFVLEDTPKDIKWPLVPEGLDSLSAALFTINIISRFIGGENHWLFSLWSMKVEEHMEEERKSRKGAGSGALDKADLQSMTLTQWNIHSLRPDGPSAFKHESMLKMFRGNLNILDYKPLVKVCEFLSDCERAGRPTASEIENLLETKRRMSHYTLSRLGMILTERYIPSIKKLGLRYRFIFTEKQKPIIHSNGQIERMILTESSHEGCTVHLEPEGSQGPSDMLHHNAIQMTVDSELISMRLDLYDKKNREWILEPWKSASRRTRRTASWLLRETEYQEEPPFKLTKRQIDLIGPILVFRGLRASRMWMLESMGFAPRTARRYLRRMLDDKILRLLYTPTLEYCGLPEGMLAVGQFKTHRARDAFIDWMASRLPFVRVFTDNSINMVAFIRLPPYKTDVVGGVIREKLSGGKKKDRITTHSFTARLRSYKTYQMTVFQRLAKEEGFIDPWTNKD